MRRARRPERTTVGLDAPKVRRRDATYRRLLAVADAVSIGLALYLAVALFGGDRLRPSALVMLPIVVLVAKTAGLYDRDEHLLTKTTLDEAPRVFEVATLCTLVFWLGERFLAVGELAQRQVLGLWGLLVVLMLLGRTLARAAAHVKTPPERCLVLGERKSAERIERKIRASHIANAVVVGRVPLHDKSSETMPGGPDRLPGVLLERDVERVIIAPASGDYGEILDAVRLVRSLGVNVSVLPRLFEVVESSVEFDEIEGSTLLGLRKDGLSRSSSMLKRTIDVVCASAGIALLAPLLAGIAVAIRLTSDGPVLFRQKRIGRHGVDFEMLKFRTMVVGAEQRKGELVGRNETEGLFKITNDPRVTRVGALLRACSLDELPQLFNVLRGEMSLVGPRPLIPEEDRRVVGWDRRRLQITPGMTGPWQLFGPTRISLPEMAKMDYLYGANWSIWLDVKILLRTIAHAFARRGV